MSNIFRVREGAHFICFDADEDSRETIQTKIISADFVRAWWNQIPNLYILETDLSSAEFKRKLHALFNEEVYLIGELTGEYGGRLTFERWRHLINASPEVIRTLEIAAAEEAERKRKALGKNA